jgi:hypothetical protein
VLQPSLVLQETFTDSGGTRRQAISYKADFQYVEDGQVVVEEVSGYSSRDFSVPMRLFPYQHRDVVYGLMPIGYPK